MNVRFNISYVITTILLGYVAFFTVSGIPVIPYLILALCALLVHLDILVTVRDGTISTVLRGLTTLVMAGIAYYMWGWSVLWGGLAMGAVGLFSAFVWGTLYVLHTRALS